MAHFLPEAGSVWKAGKPIAQWRFDRILVGNPAAGKTTAYESKIISDDGRLYLVYSASRHRKRTYLSWSTGCSIRAIWYRHGNPCAARAGRLSLGGPKPGYIQIVEGTNFAKIGSKFILLYSVGDFALNNYKLGVAYSDRLIPPPGQTYRKRASRIRPTFGATPARPMKCATFCNQNSHNGPTTAADSLVLRDLETSLPFTAPMGCSSTATALTTQFARTVMFGCSRSK